MSVLERSNLLISQYNMNFLISDISRYSQMGPTGCPETSGRNYHYSLCNNPESTVLIYLAAEA